MPGEEVYVQIAQTPKKTVDKLEFYRARLQSETIMTCKGMMVFLHGISPFNYFLILGKGYCVLYNEYV